MASGAGPPATPSGIRGLELDVERVLVTHGEPVLSAGTAELRRALERPPWILRG